MKFPGFVYKSPGKMGKVKNKTYDWSPVQNEQELSEKLAKGWYATRDEAFSPKQPEVNENALPTRAEIEQKARELGIKFDGRTSDKKLLKLIGG
jgi:hypothetical protein